MRRPSARNHGVDELPASVGLSRLQDPHSSDREYIRTRWHGRLRADGQAQSGTGKTPRAPASQPARRDIGADHEEGGARLADQPLGRGKDREPDPQPAGEVYADISTPNPASELKLLDALPDHHDQDAPKHDAGEDEHAAVRETVMGKEGQHRDSSGQSEADQRTLQDDGRSRLEAEVLQEEYDLEALTVDGGETEENQTGQGAAGFLTLRLENLPAAAIVVRDPASPVDLMEEPVHDDEKNNDREQTGGSLDIKLGRIDRGDQSDDDKPGHQGSEEGQTRAETDRAPETGIPPNETGRDRRENENRLKPFPEHENASIYNNRRRAEVRGRGIRDAVGGERLPDQDRYDAEDCRGNKDSPQEGRDSLEGRATAGRHGNHARTAPLTACSRAPTPLGKWVPRQRLG